MFLGVAQNNSFLENCRSPVCFNALTAACLQFFHGMAVSITECEIAAQKGLQCFVNGGNKIDEFSNTMVEIVDRIIFLTFVLVLCNFLLLWSFSFWFTVAILFSLIYILKKKKIKKIKKKKEEEEKKNLDSTILLMKYRSYCLIPSEQGEKKQVQKIKT